MKFRQSGFTLVEIAIVLVIVGLLLGGVLKGQELINNTKVKNTVNLMRGAQAAYNSYLDRFHAIPGDDLGASVRFPIAGAVPAATNGNGDGAIAGGKFNNAGVEAKNFWQHIRRAGLADGSTLAPTTAAQDYLPSNPYGGFVGINSTMNITGLIGALSTCANNVSGEAALRLDEMMDNGQTDSGGFMARANIATGAAQNNIVGATAKAAIAPATAYTVCTGF